MARREMDQQDPIDLVIMLKIVEYLSTRAIPAEQLGQVDAGQIISVVNYLASGASIGSLFHKEADSRQQISIGDKYVTGQAGAVGPASLAIGQRYNQIWNQNQTEINLVALADELTRLRAEIRLTAKTVDEDVALSDLGRAEVAAREGDGPRVMAHLAQAGRWVLAVAKEVGTELAAKAIERSLGM